MTQALRTRALTTSDWEIIEALFGSKGACAGCWCMFWRVPKGGKYWQEMQGAGNRKAFKQLVETGQARGVLAFEGEKPIGWLSVAPKGEFAYFKRSRVFKTLDSPEGTWAVTCFFIIPGYRRAGLAVRLLEAAKEVAAAKGAKYLEGYPSQPRNKEKPIPAAFAHTGVPKIFEKAGFSELAKMGQDGCRPVFRLSLYKITG